MSEIDDKFSESIKIFDNYVTLYNKVNNAIQKTKNSKQQEDINNLYELTNTAFNKLDDYMMEIRKNKGTSYDKAKELYPTRNPASWGREPQYDIILSRMDSYKNNLQSTINRMQPSTNTVLSDLEKFISKF